MEVKTVRLDEDEVKWLTRYSAPFSVQLREELRLVRSLLQIGEVGIAGKFTVAEGCAVVDVLNGCVMDPVHLSGYSVMLAAEVSDGCTLNGLDEKWGIERKALVEKLKALTPIEALAVVHLARIFWADPNAETLKKRIRALFRCLADT